LGTAEIQTPRKIFTKKVTIPQPLDSWFLYLKRKPQHQDPKLHNHGTIAKSPTNTEYPFSVTAIPNSKRRGGRNLKSKKQGTKLKRKNKHLQQEEYTALQVTLESLESPIAACF
jgi:hypothetical protein